MQFAKLLQEVLIVSCVTVSVHFCVAFRVDHCRMVMRRQWWWLNRGRGMSGLRSRKVKSEKKRYEEGR